MINKLEAKNFESTYLYYKGGYDKTIASYVIGGHRIDKSEETFEDVKYAIKKEQITSELSTVLMSPNVVLMIGNTPMPRSFKVVVCKDIKEDKTKLKVFIDCTDIIKVTDGVYEFNRRATDILVSYLFSAMNALIYHVQPTRIVGNATIVNRGTECFAKLFSYVIDYLRIGGVDGIRENTMYLSAIYFQKCILRKDDSDSIYIKAKSISGISDLSIAKIKILTGSDEHMYDNIDTFIKALSKVIKTEHLTTDLFVSKWIYLFGSGTQFGMELYTSFSDMILFTYVGSRLNNQNTIEKILKTNLVDFTKGILKVGADSL